MKKFLSLVAMITTLILVTPYAHARDPFDFSVPKRGALTPQSPQSESLIPISQVTFVASPKWYVLTEKAHCRRRIGLQEVLIHTYRWNDHQRKEYY